MKEDFKVPEISCGHCKSSIEGALAPVAGVREALVSIDDKRVAVDYDESVTDRASVVRAIESAGYEVAG